MHFKNIKLKKTNITVNIKNYNTLEQEFLILFF